MFIWDSIQFISTCWSYRWWILCGIVVVLLLFFFYKCNHSNNQTRMLREDMNRLLFTPEQTIFVGIISVEKAMLTLKMIQELFNHAVYPGRVFVGVINYESSSSGSSFWNRLWNESLPRSQVRVIHRPSNQYINHDLSLNDLIQSSYRNESYFLHMPSDAWLKPQWDDLLIKMSQEHPSQLPVVITQSPTIVSEIERSLLAPSDSSTWSTLPGQFMCVGDIHPRTHIPLLISNKFSSEVVRLSKKWTAGLFVDKQFFFISKTTVPLFQVITSHDYDTSVSNLFQSIICFQKGVCVIHPFLSMCINSSVEVTLSSGHTASSLRELVYQQGLPEDTVDRFQHFIGMNWETNEMAALFGLMGIHPEFSSDVHNIRYRFPDLANRFQLLTRS